eukprot:5790608-Prymnesium_polylepis.1
MRPMSDAQRPLACRSDMQAPSSARSVAPPMRYAWAPVRPLTPVAFRIFFANLFMRATLSDVSFTRKSGVEASAPGLHGSTDTMRQSAAYVCAPIPSPFGRSAATAVYWSERREGHR